MCCVPTATRSAAFRHYSLSDWTSQRRVVSSELTQDGVTYFKLLSQLEDWSLIVLPACRITKKHKWHSETMPSLLKSSCLSCDVFVRLKLTKSNSFLRIVAVLMT